MKKVIFFCILSLLVLTSCLSTKSVQLEPIEFDVVKSHNGRFEYQVDPRIELMAIICRLTGYNVFNYNYNGDNLYLTQVDSFFAKYKDESVIKTAQGFMDRGVWGDAFISLAYHIKPDFSGTTVSMKPLPTTLNPQWEKIGSSSINTFVKQVHDFAIKSNFIRFYAINRSDYLSNIVWLDDGFEKKNVGTWAEDFFKGIDIGETTVVSSRVIVGWNLYDFAGDSDGKRSSYVASYPGAYYADMTGAYFSLYLQDYLNQNWDTVKDTYTKFLKSLLKKLHPEEDPKVYDKREVTRNDLAADLSIYCYIAYLEDNIATAKEDDDYFKPNYDAYYAYFEKSIGDVFLKCMDLLKEYKENRDKYPEFKDFYPRLNDYVNSLPAE